MWVLSVGGGRQPPLRVVSSPWRHYSVFVILYLFLLLRASTLPRHGDVQLYPGPASRRSPTVANDGQDLNFKSCHVPSSGAGAIRRGAALSHGAAPSRPPSSSLSVLHFNARSLLPKRAELHLICSQYQPDVTAISESWLDDKVPDGSFLLPGYSVAYHADRIGRVGGGVVLLCRNGVQFCQRPDLCCWRESAWIELRQLSSSRSRSRSLLVGCYYRPPKCGTNDVEEFITSLDASFSNLDLSSTDVVIVGDFNATNSEWCDLDSTNTPGRLLEQAFLSLGVHQCVSTRTHLDFAGH